jgi:NCS1 family nucleobase:cation symporter-1
LPASFIFFGPGPRPGRELSACRALHFHAQYGWAYLVAAVWLNSMTAAWLTMITDAADFCRYTRSRKDMWWGTMLAGPGHGILRVAGRVWAAASLGRQANPFSLAAAVDPHWVTLLVLLIVIALDESTINVMNLYTGGSFSLQHVRGPGPLLEHAVCGVVSTGLSALPVLLERLVPLTTALGNLFAPLAGVLLFHYLFVEHMRIDVAALLTPKAFITTGMA